MRTVYCDGSCLGNPGPGGWAFLAVKDAATGMDEVFCSGGEYNTTNNRMELTAACKAIEAVGDCTIHADSKYLLQGITSWIAKWKQNGWRTASKQPVANVDLWQQLDKLHSQHSIKWIWVRGHNNNILHDRVDLLARQFAERIKLDSTSPKN